MVLLLHWIGTFILIICVPLIIFIFVKTKESKYSSARNEVTLLLADYLVRGNILTLGYLISAKNSIIRKYHIKELSSVSILEELITYFMTNQSGRRSCDEEVMKELNTLLRYCITGNYRRFDDFETLEYPYTEKEFSSIENNFLTSEKVAYILIIVTIISFVLTTWIYTKDSVKNIPFIDLSSPLGQIFIGVLSSLIATLIVTIIEKLYEKLF